MAEVVKPEIARTVAANLRRARSARGLSLSELARLSGTAKASLSRLELGHGNPTLATLFALADALGVPLGELIAETDPGPSLVRADEGPRVTRGSVEARYVREIHAGPDLIEVYELDVDPTRAEISEPHRPGVWEYVLVLAGPMLVGPATDLVRLETGDFVSFRADRPHRYVADGGRARALCLVHYPGALARGGRPGDPPGVVDR